MKLEAALSLAPELAKWYDQDVSVYVTDTEKFVVACNHPNLDLRIKEGDSLEKYKGSMTYKSLVTKQRIEAYVSKSDSIFGVGYVAICNPIIDDGQVVGVMTVDISTERYDALVTSGEEILAAVEQMSASSENLSAMSEELAATSKNMTFSTGDVKSSLGFIEDIVTQIKTITAQSKILGINASIEAARAGEYGRGFGVVAQEVRKLAENTNSSAANIEANLNRLHSSVQVLIESINQLATVSESQAEGVVDLTGAINQISTMAEGLVNMGRKSSPING